MAWGYWSATTVSDRGRSPRRNQNGTVNHQQSMPVTIEDRPSVSQTYAGVPVNSNNNNTSSSTNTTVQSEFEEVPTFSRRPSLDLTLVGPQGALAGILCAAHSSKQGGTLSAGNTLTRVGSKHTAVEYAVPHHLYHHHPTYIEYHHKQLSFSDDDSSSEPGYATGLYIGSGVCSFGIDQL
ncbi:hypothetical protein Zmor_023464 [Zophobas morio]|uniref:Uncharacterized protein n=1 Tax=Zophobas morio TaxID=2755281 RepID=A0AA38I0V9_9CUCU|nr:hypothetical protein Zmor_023464 [Zophobas morio]